MRGETRFQLSLASRVHLMWAPIKNLLARSKGLNIAFGEVLFHTPQQQGVYDTSFFEWRVKKSIDNTKTYISVAMRADSYAGVEGSLTNYINFDIETAVRLRDDLDECIKFAQRSV